MYKAWTTDPTVLFHQLFGQSDDNFAGSKRFIKGLTVWYLESFYYSFLCNFFQWIFCLFRKAWCYCPDCPRIERNNPLKPPHEPYVDMCWWVDKGSKWHSLSLIISGGKRVTSFISVILWGINPDTHEVSFKPMTAKLESE